jgi:large subunit ribosomal protein L13
LASEIAKILRGKHKPIYTPHVDCGDFVIVVNADKVRVTGRKLDQKMYYRHSGYPGGLKSISLRDQLARHPERVIEAAVRGMLPKNRLGRRMIKKMKVYASPTHPHQAQQPKPLEL